MTRRLGASVRELAAAKIGMKLAAGSLTTDEAARILAESDAQHWDRIDESDREYYRTCADNLLQRISEPPLGIGMTNGKLWKVVTSSYSA